MGKAIEMIGRRFGHWVVLKEVPKVDPRKRRFLCHCDCGVEYEVDGGNLLNGQSNQCKTCSAKVRGNAPRKQRSKIRKPYNIVGERFGKWLVESEVDKINNCRAFLCKCDCGIKKILTGNTLRSGSKQCKDCTIKSRVFTGAPPKHGMTGTKIYKTWDGIKCRCLNPKDKHYPMYGGRGITMCKQWQDSFEAFVEDMGLPPSSKHSIDRINNDGNYEPGNCRWATVGEQAQNKRTNISWIFNGETHVIAEWARKFGIQRQVLLKRIYHGWSIEKTLTTPVKHKRTGKITTLCSPESAAQEL